MLQRMTCGAILRAIQAPAIHFIVIYLCSLAGGAKTAIPSLVVVGFLTTSLATIAVLLHRHQALSQVTGLLRKTVAATQWSSSSIAVTTAIAEELISARRKVVRPVVSAKTLNLGQGHHIAYWF